MTKAMTKRGRKIGQTKGGVSGSKSLALIPQRDIDKLHQKVFQVVKQNANRVQEVLDGKRQWNPQQVKLYLALLDKVMPNLTQSHNIHEHRTMEEMSMEELMDIARSESDRISRADRASAALPVIDAETSSPPPPPPLTASDTALDDAISNAMNRALVPSADHSP